MPSYGVQTSRSSGALKRSRVDPAGNGTCSGASNKSAKRVKIGRKFGSTARSESVHSDTPTISSGGHSPSAHPCKFDLQNAYPSIASCDKRLRALKGSGDVDAMRALAQVFLSCLHTVLHTVDRLPEEVCQQKSYQSARAAVMFIGELFSTQAVKPSTDRSEAGKIETVEMAVQLMTMTVSTLVKFLQTAEAIYLSFKPLPTLPVHESNGPEVPIIVVTEDPASPRPSIGSQSRLDEPALRRKSLAMLASEVLHEESLLGCSSTSPSPEFLTPPPSTDRSSLQSAHSSKTFVQKGQLIQLILQKARNSSLLSFTGSATTCLDEETQIFLDNLHTSGETLNHGDTEQPYAPRHSALYFPVDPLNPDIDVELPPLSEDAMAVRLDSQGKYKAASLTALIRLLTSKDVVTDRHLCEMFFFGFRFYISPREVVQKLIERYDERMPMGTPRQLDVWATNQANIVRPRVLSLIHKWLYQYWLPDIDNITVLELLQTFLLRELPAGKIPQETGASLLQGLHSVQTGELSRQIFLRRRLTQIASGSMIKIPEPTGFKAKLTGTNIQQFLQFDSSAGREELARQLTVKASELFGTLDPEGVVRFWLRDEKAQKATRAEEELLVETAASIERQIDRIVGGSHDRIEKYSSGQKARLVIERDEVLQRLIELRVVAEAHRNAVREAESRCVAIVHWERSLHMFVIHTILHFGNTPCQRIALIKFWWRVCAICLRMNNFSCAITIFVATTNSCISRLRNTLPLMDGDTRALYATLNPFFADRKLYSDRMFSILDKGVEPVVPSLPSLKRGIDILTDAIPSTLAIKAGGKTRGLNLYAFRSIGECVSAMEQAQLPYKLSSNPVIQDLLDSQLASFDPLREDEIMRDFDRRSDEVEPRASVPPVVRKIRHDPWVQCVRKVRVKGNIEFRLYCLNDPKIPPPIPYAPEDFTSCLQSASAAEKPASGIHQTDKENIYPSTKGFLPSSQTSSAFPSRTRAPSLVQRIMKH